MAKRNIESSGKDYEIFGSFVNLLLLRFKYYRFFRGKVSKEELGSYDILLWDRFSYYREERVGINETYYSRLCERFSFISFVDFEKRF